MQQQSEAVAKRYRLLSARVYPSTLHNTYALSSSTSVTQSFLFGRIARTQNVQKFLTFRHTLVN
jgi:hypothetical protein